MTTYRFGSYFSIAAFTVIGALSTAFLLLPAYRMRLFIWMAIPALVMIAGRRLVRCKVCGKSAFLHEIFSQETWLGAATNPRRMLPEKTCSRCRADLTTQDQ